MESFQSSFCLTLYSRHVKFHKYAKTSFRHCLGAFFVKRKMKLWDEISCPHSDDVIGNL